MIEQDTQTTTSYIQGQITGIQAILLATVMCLPKESGEAILKIVQEIKLSTDHMNDSVHKNAFMDGFQELPSRIEQALRDSSSATDSHQEPTHP